MSFAKFNLSSKRPRAITTRSPSSDIGNARTFWRRSSRFCASGTSRLRWMMTYCWSERGCF
nr:MAG TPA: hypothetical protein [Caudoviricetes sp.]